MSRATAGATADLGLLLDTSVLIEAERGRLRLGNFEQEEVGVSVIALGEYWRGVERATSASQRSGRERFFDAILKEFTVIDIQLGEALAFARVWADLARAGTMIGSLDLLIAATAIRRGWRLATLDVRDFARVPGLDIVDLSV